MNNLDNESLQWLREAAGLNNDDYINYDLEVDGRKYRFYVEQQEESNNQKFFHRVIDEEGKDHAMDWSPYSIPEKGEVALWIKLGMPGRISKGPLTSEDLNTLARKRAG